MKRKTTTNTQKPENKAKTPKKKGKQDPNLGKRKYEPFYHPAKINELAREGLTIKQILPILGITQNTFYKWNTQYIEFKTAYLQGREPVDIKVENALLKRALGYEYEEITTEGVKDPKTGEIKGTRIRKTVRHVPGDVGAQQFWLIARKPHVWKSAQKIDITSKDESINMPPVIIGAPPIEIKK